MQIDLSLLEPAGWSARELFGPEVFDQGEVRTLHVNPVRAELVASLRRETSGQRLVRASGRVSARVRAECDRCVRPVEFEVEGDFDQRYSWGAGPSAGSETEIAPQDLDIACIEGHVLDTSDLVWEQIELLAPVRIVCGESCAGLCQTCGADLNAGMCGCEIESIDARWAPLKQFKK
jgi:uncharacterized protein